MNTGANLPEVRAGTIGDAEAIVALSTSDFAQALLPLFVYGCHGAAAWVRAQIAMSRALQERRYTVATADGCVVGVADLSRAGTGLHLAYIAVARAWRREGLASRLLLHALQAEETADRAILSLDVFDDNVSAGRWYEQLGFQQESERLWWAGTNDAPAGEPQGVTVIGAPAADAVHHDFGFSQLALLVDERRIPVGRMGTDWFRLSEAAWAADPRVRQALKCLSPERGILVESNVGHVVSGFTLLARARRMCAPVAELLPALESHRTAARTR